VKWVVLLVVVGSTIWWGIDARRRPRRADSPSRRWLMVAAAVSITVAWVIALVAITRAV